MPSHVPAHHRLVSFLIILELDIPGPDGFEVVARLRKGQLRSIPLLIYTASDLTTADRKRLTLGESRHLTKSPGSQTRFVSVVRELLDGLL
ncbi:MAG: CheY-like chemotaxis protein [Myxococcota bacterium]|jgi:CheY-like chemotaxis protein